MTDTDEDLTDLLEADYRRLLQWYPRSWRQAHGAALLGTLLDDADARDSFLVRRGEWRDFAAAGIAARLDLLVGRRVRDAAATVVLSMGTGVAVVDFVASSWAPWDIDDVRAFGPFLDAGPILAVLWLAAFAAAQLGRWRVGRIALLISILVAVGMHPVETLVVPAHFFAVGPALLGFQTACAVVAVIGTPRRGLGLLGATAGWVALGSAGSALAPVVLGYAVDRSTSLTPLLSYPGDWPSVLDYLPLGVAALLFMFRVWSAGFTVLLATVPLAVALDSYAVWVAAQPWTAPPNPLPLLVLNIPITAGLVVLVCASRGLFALPTRHQGAQNNSAGII